MAPTPSAPTRSKKKPGPKPKSLSQRPFKVPQQAKRVKRTHSESKKVEVVRFLMHHRILKRPGPEPDTTPHDERSTAAYRRPTQVEAAEYFKLRPSTVGDWWRNRHTILNGAEDEADEQPEAEGLGAAVTALIDVDETSSEQPALADIGVNDNDTG